MTLRQNVRVKIGYVIAYDRKRRRRRSIALVINEYDKEIHGLAEVLVH